MSKTLPSFAWHERDVVTWSETIVSRKDSALTRSCPRQQRRVLDLAMSETVDETPQPVYESQDKVVAKVATLFGILEQLGFRPERIEECIRKVKTLEIEDCLDWVRLIIRGLPLSAPCELISRLAFRSCTSTPTPTSCEGKDPFPSRSSIRRLLRLVGGGTLAPRTARIARERLRRASPRALLHPCLPS